MLCCGKQSLAVAGMKGGRDGRRGAEPSRNEQHFIRPAASVTTRCWRWREWRSDQQLQPQSDRDAALRSNEAVCPRCWCSVLVFYVSLFFVLFRGSGWRWECWELARAGQGRCYTSNQGWVHILTDSIDTCSQVWTGPKRYCDESQCVCPRTDEPLTRAVRCRQNRDQRPDFGENRNAGLAMHCGDPRRVRTSRVGRCTGFVQWAQFSVLAPWLRRFPVYFVPGDELLPRFCSRRRREACGGLIFS